MILHIANPIAYSTVYFYGLSLFVGAIVCWLAAGLLIFDPDNYVYTATPRYLRSRRLTAGALVVFGTGFFLQWALMLKFSNPLAAHVLSVMYFHIGGTLFSMSHTSLIDRHYLTRNVVVRDIAILVPSIVVDVAAIYYGSYTLMYTGAGLFFLHIGHLTAQFYHSFHRVYLQLGSYAEYSPNNTDCNVRWLFYSCHLIIAFGIGGIVFTLVFQHQLTPFTILMSVGTVVFAYIYKALDGFSAEAYETELNLQRSEQFLETDKGKKEMEVYTYKRNKGSIFNRLPLFSGFVKQW